MRQQNANNVSDTLNIEVPDHVDFPSIAPFEVLQPSRRKSPFIFNSPHSGVFYPKSFLDASRLSAKIIRCSEDTFVEELFGEVIDLGAPLLKANFPRAYLDVNREPYELDPRMFEGDVPPYANSRSIRVAGGLGTVARIVAEGREIYKHKIPVEQALTRIEMIYKPYHRCLRRMLAQTHVEYGQGFLIDCHSMPSGISENGRSDRPDFVIGDRYGTSCSGDLTRLVVDAFSARGYRVARNKPYAGGFITEHYGRPGRNLHALQIEINRGLYMNEATHQKNQNFEKVRSDITDTFEAIFALTAFDAFPDTLAAE